jgi:hypothetical protein
VTRPELQAVFDEDDAPHVLARRYFYVPAPSRDGTSGARSQAGCVFLHEPTVAVLLPSDLPLLSHRRPDFGNLRHVLVRFSFMLGRLPLKHAYASATFTVTLDHPNAVVRLQRPAWGLPEDSESTESVTTELSAAVDSLAKLGARRTWFRGTTRHGSGLPMVIAEKRSRGDFGWRYEARDNAPLVPRIEYLLAWIELPCELTELNGHLSADAEIEVPRFGVLRTLQAMPGAPATPFRLALGGPAAPGTATITPA